MKRKGTHWFWVFMAALLLADIVVMVGQCAPKSPLNPSEVSEVYSKYVGMDGLDVTFLKDYPLSDSVAVDVTLIEATTDSAWAVLYYDFNLSCFPVKHNLKDDTHTVAFGYAPHNNYRSPQDSILVNNDFIVVYFFKHTISVFNIESESQVDEIIYCHIQNISKYT